MIDYNKLIQLIEQVKAVADNDICLYFSEKAYNTHKDKISKLPYSIKVYPNEAGPFQEDNVYVVSKKGTIKEGLDGRDLESNI